MKIIKYLNFKQIIFSILCASLLSLFSLPKIDAGPVSSDDYQYWYIATHLSKTGEYGFTDPSSNDKSDFANPLNNSGIRRGESLYPFIISNLINLTTTKSELNSINSDCIYGINDGLCPILGGTSVLVNLLFTSFKFLLIFFTTYFFYDKLSKRSLLFLALLLCATFPYTNKDLITYALLFFYFISYYEFLTEKTQLALRYGSLSLLPLTNPIFFYFLFIKFLISTLFMLKNKEINKKSIALLLLCMSPSILWSTRNTIQTGEFTITSRGSETVGIRAEFLSIDYQDIPAGIIYFTPPNRITNVFTGYLWNKVGSSDNWEQLFDRSYDNSKLRLGHQKRGYVYERMKDNLGYSMNQKINYEDVVNQQGYVFATNEYRKASLDLIFENKLKYISTSSMFLYRGLFPEFNQLKSEIRNTKIGFFLNEFLLFLRFFPIIYCFYLLIKTIKTSIYDIQNYLFLYIFFSYGLLTHFIPRYSALLMPFAIYLLIKNNTLIKSIK